MESQVCMNELCGASLSMTAAAGGDGGGGGGGGDIKKGWNLRSGGVANLCDRCSTAYEQQGFCELFHRDDTGWRECTSCAKRLHCGCIASSAFLELHDNGGVTCVSSRNGQGHKPMQRKREEKSKETGISVEHTVGEIQLSSINNHAKIGNLNETMLTQMNDEGADNVKSLLPSASKSQMKHEENVHPSGENGLKEVFGSLVQTNLAIGLDASTIKPVFYPGKAVQEQNSKSRLSYFQQGTWSRHILPKSILPREFINANAGVSTPIRVARPPVEGRIKSQLLPRYWPRITDQELQQISGDSNVIVVPLFEKVLSASDAGRIGRLVLPKACAEAYFPPISQPEGLPLRIQDVKGNEWLFQFRFWPNNNSRMYVLEGVTPCIQSMQLLAGDTVMFSRMEPEGKLLMGFRKAPTSTCVQLLKGNMYPNLNEFSRNVNLPNRDIWPTNEQHGSKLIAGSFPPSVLIPEKKRSRNIGSKSKRLLIESQNSLELKQTWEESQEMLFPAPLLTPSIVTIDDNVFEEYEGPPIFGKGSIFSVCSSGDQEQWAQCDNCSKWRKLPADFLLPPKWTCQDNLWDRNRAACVGPDELNPRELENLLRLAQGFQKGRNFLSHKPEQEQGHNILVDAETASVAIWDNEAEPSIAMTTKHPRHRPGCSCIVCIQPPSGKGKHKPTCTCNVCMTVKRRFTTLMLRKKKRQSELEASIVLKNFKEEADVERMQVIESRVLEHGNSSKGHLDLNITPYRGEDNHGQTSRSMMSLIQVANLPLEMYLRQNGLTSLISEQQASSSSHILPQETGETEGGDEADDAFPAPVVQEDKVGKNGKPDNIQDSCL